MIEAYKLIALLLPSGLMIAAMLVSWLPGVPDSHLWRTCLALSVVALACTIALAVGAALPSNRWVSETRLGIGMAILVQLLGTVIAAFSSRYLEGESAQPRYISALAGVLASVQVLLLANHWLILIGAWAAVGVALQQLLCFYSDRPFALLAAHKKMIADRVADVLLAAAAALTWHRVGGGSFDDLRAYLGQNGMTAALQVSTVCLVLAVVIRTALLPVHGWLIQVMEAPTPVSALLHAGVVNLGGYVLIRFAPLLDGAIVAQVLLVVSGLATAFLAGLTMLTRISVKVRLAWSTLAQMGFLLMECGLGLYTLAALHLIGHSLYKAHGFLSASMAVRQTRLQDMRGVTPILPISLVFAPLVAVTVVLIISGMSARSVWPWWWCGVLGFAWAPLLWLPVGSGNRAVIVRAMSGLGFVIGLTAIAVLVHAFAFDIRDTPKSALGFAAMLGMAALYTCLVAIQVRPTLLEACRRWSYAGFYLDEIYTRIALQSWTTRLTGNAQVAR